MALCQGRFGRRIRGRLGVWLVALFAAASVGKADVVNLGLLSFDEAIPGAINTFTVINFTESFALPPDFPVLQSVTFHNASLLLTDSSGSVLPPIDLGDIVSGDGALPALQFLNSRMFQAAEFRATLSPFRFAMPDGKAFTADSVEIDTLLLPGAALTLTAGFDFAVIAVTGATTDVVVPEPSGIILIFTVGCILSMRRSYWGRKHTAK